MSPVTSIQPLIYGLQTGLTYVLVALGLTIMLSIMNVINLAHGEIYMLGAYTAFYLTGLLNLNYGLTLVLCVIIVGIIGLFLERVFFRPAHGETVPTVIVSIGLIWILQTAALIIFGGQPRGMKEVFQGTETFIGVNISDSRILAGLISLLLVGAVYILVYRTNFGKAMQAVAQDREAAALQGIQVRRIGAIGFGLGCALAGVAGGIMAPIFFIDPTMGTGVLVNSLAIIILGGLGSIPGTVIGGLILGVVESYGTTFLGYSSVIFPFLIIMFVLIFKRTGLMGRET